MNTTLRGLAGIIAAASEDMAHHKERLKKAAEIIEKEAKAELGTYQAAAGVFAEWPPLAERTLETNVNNTPGLVTGEMRDSIGSAVDEHEAVIGSNDPKLLWFEIGTKTQPPRHVLGGSIVRKEKQIVRILGHGAVARLVGGSTDQEI